MRPASRRFSIRFVALDVPRRKSKAQPVESIVSHPLKFAEGGAAASGLMEGWASQPGDGPPISGSGAHLQFLQILLQQ